jgi:hypothetical protein
LIARTNALGKKISRKQTSSVAQGVSHVTVGRGVVHTLNGDGTISVYLNGDTTVAIVLDDCTGGTAFVGGTVEVLIAPPRHLALPLRGTSPFELLDVQFGTLPPAGVPLRPIFDTKFPIVAGAAGLANIDITPLGLVYGYTPYVTVGNSFAGVNGLITVSAGSTLTTLQLQGFLISGAYVSSGNGFLANYIIIGA